MTRLSVCASLLFVAFALIGCAPTVDGPGARPGAGRAHLEVVGAAEVQTEAGMELELAFRYLDAAGVTVPDGLVDIVIVGDAAGARLSAASAATDALGVATVVVRTADDGAFEVEASAHGADPARVAVTVRPMVYGTLGYEVTYMGSRALSHAEAGLFVNATCDDLVRAVPAPRAVERVAIGGRGEQSGLELGVPMALTVLGIDRADQVAAVSCHDVFLDAEAQDVTVRLVDTEVAIQGPYATVERFDVTDGFPSGLDTVLEVAAGLSSADPAAWLVEQVAASPSTPSAVRTALSTSFTRGLVADLLRDALRSVHTPSELSSIAGFGGDVDAAFRDLTLEGQLDFTRPDELGVANGTHRITNIRVPRADGTSVSRPVDVSADVVVSFGDRIDMDEHALTLPFGHVVEVVLYDALLSDVAGAPSTMGEMVGDYFDCAAIAAVIGSGTTATIARTACSAGVSMLEARVDGAIASLWDYDTLHLAGSADLRDADQDYDLETIDRGEAHARWARTGTSLSGATKTEGLP
jgi:hypothetical protein